jgi:hypothetical protein
MKWQTKMLRMLSATTVYRTIVISPLKRCARAGVTAQGADAWGMTQAFWPTGNLKMQADDATAAAITTRRRSSDQSVMFSRPLKNFFDTPC